MPLKEFIDVNAPEGLARSIATLDAFKEAVFPSCVNGMSDGTQESLLEDLCVMDALGINYAERKAIFAASLVVGAALVQKGKKDGN